MTDEFRAFVFAELLLKNVKNKAEINEVVKEWKFFSKNLYANKYIIRNFYSLSTPKDLQKKIIFSKFSENFSKRINDFISLLIDYNLLSAVWQINKILSARVYRDDCLNKISQ